MKNIFCLFLFYCTVNLVFAEGTKNIMPDSTKPVNFVLHDIGLAGIDYYTYQADSLKRLHIRIGDVNNERIYFGFKLRTTHPKWGSALTTNLFMRLRDPLGNIVMGPQNVPTSNVDDGFIEYYSQALNGPDIVNSGGYNSDLFFRPSIPGDYYIEFNGNDPNNYLGPFWTMFEYFDISVVDMADTSFVDGRVWTNSLYLNTPPLAGQGNFDATFDTAVYIYHSDSILTSVEFDGMRGLGFTVFTNNTGPDNTSNVATDRQSVAGQVESPEHQVYLSFPDTLEFPITDGEPEIIGGAEVVGCNLLGHELQLKVSHNGFLDGYFDINNNGVNDGPGSVDVEYLDYAVRGNNIVSWDGNDGLGNPVLDGTPITIYVKYNAGVTHLPLYDVEYNPNGFEITNIAPAGGVQDVFWDDTPVSGADNSNIACDGLTAICHNWAALFGDNRTISTWWVTHYDYDTVNYIVYDDCLPIAQNDTVSVPLNTLSSINVQINDSDPNGDPLSTSIFSGPNNGIAVINGLNIDYTPNLGFNGTDTITYVICDGAAPFPNLCDTAIIFITIECDDDNIPVSVEGTGDNDGDGIPNNCDLDSDNDGITDAVEGTGDSDNDGIIDLLDLDSDNDGIPDAIEANNGIAPNGYDPFKGRITGTDTDNDGLLDDVDNAPVVAYTAASVSPLPVSDYDGDLVNDYIDRDADNDGILDVIEAGSQDVDLNGAFDNQSDANQDGIHDALLSNPLTLNNTDGSGFPNYIDQDSDHDGIVDNREGQLTSAFAAVLPFADVDGDGISDQHDINSGNNPITPVDTDNDGADDYVDTDSDDDSVMDNIEGNDNNQDGAADGAASGNDADNDGIDDGYDADGGASFGGYSNYSFQNTDGDAEADWRDLDDDADGIPTYNELPDANPSNGIPDYFEVAPCGARFAYYGLLTISGNADAVQSQNGVTNPNNTRFAPDGAFGELRNNDWIIVDLTDTVPNGETIVLTFSKASGGGNARATIDQSIDAVAFSNGQQYTSTVTNPTFESFNYVLTTDARYIRVTRNNRRLAFDACAYSFKKPDCRPDQDGDGIENSADLDDDNDGLLDAIEGTGDSDGDGITDDLDLDSDNDGIPDAVEANNGDLPANMVSQGFYPASYAGLNDGNNNGWVSDVDNAEGGTNLQDISNDADGLQDRLDLDSDADGIPDGIEANSGVLDPNMDDNGQFPTAYVITNDTDMDGTPDLIDTDNGGTVFVNPDTDGDTDRDYLDLDADDDGDTDNEEGFDPNVLPLNNDNDGDGIDDAYDSGDGGSPTTLPDIDGNGVPNYLERCLVSAQNGNWNDPNTWGGSVPNCNTCVDINHTITIDNPSFGSTVNIGSNGSIDNNNQNLTVYGDLLNDGGSITNTGTVTMKGSSLQSIGGDISFSNLAICNTNGVEIDSGVICINDLLTLDQGTLTTTNSDSVVLKATSSNTAMVSGTGTGNISGDIVQERYVDGCAGFLMLGAPFNMTMADFRNIYFQGFTGAYLPADWNNTYLYDETVLDIIDSGYYSPSNITDPISGGTGFLVYNFPTQGAYNFNVKGPFNMNPFNFPISYNTSPFGNLNDGYNLVSNPYPATLDWKAGSGWNKVNCCDAIYSWNRCSQQYSSFVSGVSVNGGTQYIPPMGAFWIKAHSGGASVSVTRDAIVDVEQAYYRTIPLEVLNIQVNSYGYADETALSFGDTASAHGQGTWYGAYKLRSNSIYHPSLYSMQHNLSNGEVYEMAINMQLNIPDSFVQIKFQAGFISNYELTFAGTEEFNPSYCLILEDQETNSFINIRQDTSYTFYAADTLLSDRFRLHFNKSFSVANDTMVCKGSSSGAAIATSLSGTNGIWKWYTNNTIIQTTYSTADSITNLSAGVYSVIFEDTGSFCGATKYDFEIMKGNLPEFNLYDQNTTHCDSANGAIIISNIDPADSLSFYWSNGTTFQNLLNIDKGTYAVTVTDFKGCKKDKQATVAGPAHNSAWFVLNPDSTLTIDLSQEDTLRIFDFSVNADSIVWVINGQVYINDTVIALPLNDTGMISIHQLVFSNGCENDYQQNVQIINSGIVTNNIEKQNIDKVSIFPNPAQNVVGILFSKNQKVPFQIELFDMQGKSVLSKAYSGGEFIKMTLNQLNNGNYIMKITSENHIIQSSILEIAQ
jgi:hypothetical protein